MHPCSEHVSTLEDLEESSQTCPLCKLFLHLFISANSPEQFDEILRQSKLGVEFSIQIVRSTSDDFRFRWLRVTQADNSSGAKVRNSSPVLLCFETGM